MQWPLVIVEWEIPPWENPKSQDVDSDSQENYQEENIVSLQHLSCEMEAIETNCRR